MSKDSIFCTKCSYVLTVNTQLDLPVTENCPQCGNFWTGEEKRSTMIEVTMPIALSGGAG
tara:strand:- start:155 stop:334 length:180 start_codon:yes stop_codon:yes gene_type:complete